MHEKHALAVEVGETTIVSRQPGRVWKDNRWLWFPQINRFSTGELIVGFWMLYDERYPEGGDIGGYCISRDGGQTLPYGRYLISVSEAAPVLCRGGARYTATIRNCRRAPPARPFSPHSRGAGNGARRDGRGLEEAHGL